MFNNKFEEARKDKRLNNRSFAELIGINETAYSKLKKDKLPVGEQTKYKIEASLSEYNFDWLMFGKGFKYKKDNLTPAESQTLDKAVDKMFTTDTEPIAANFLPEHKPNMYKVPLKAWGGFMAGYENKVFDDNIEKVYFPLVKGECYAFEIDGYSMLPDYKPNDYFVGKRINGFDWLVKGRDYVFQTIDGLILKRFISLTDGECIVESINPEYNPVKPIPLKQIKALYQREGVWAI